MFKAATAKKLYCKLGVGVLGHHIDAKISPKASSEKAQTTMSENRYPSPKIDVLQTAILTLLAPTGDKAWAHLPPLQSCSIAACLRSFPSAFDRPSIPAVR